VAQVTSASFRGEMFQVWCGSSERISARYSANRRERRGEPVSHGLSFSSELRCQRQSEPELKSNQDEGLAESMEDDDEIEGV
jgi:hypothetical protein